MINKEKDKLILGREFIWLGENKRKILLELLKHDNLWTKDLIINLDLKKCEVTFNVYKLGDMGLIISYKYSRRKNYELTVTGKLVAMEIKKLKELYDGTDSVNSR